MQRAKKDADKRLENALYLDSRLKEIPGIIPYKLTEGATDPLTTFILSAIKKSILMVSPGRSSWLLFRPKESPVPADTKPSIMTELWKKH